MSTILTLAGFILSLGFGGPAMALDLPADILADQYLLEATEALEQGNSKTALRAFEKIEALDTEPPMEFLFFYGKLLVEHGTTLEDMRKGEGLLKQFVINVEKDSEHYRPTLKLLLMAEENIGKIKVVEQQQAEAARRQVEQEAAAAQQRAVRRQELLRLSLENLKQQMVTVQGGTFMMGCIETWFFEESSCEDDKNKPGHQVLVHSFAISKYEVTQDLWEAVMGKNPSHFKGCAQCPVERVSWNDIQVFLEQLNTLMGEQYRLPTEAEWEYAARGGHQNQEYDDKIGDSLDSYRRWSDKQDSVAWYRKNSGGRTHQVGQKRPNTVGLYDMKGNAEEWVQDCWNDSYQGAPDDGRAWESGDCSQRVFRGSNYRDFTPKTFASRRSNDTDYKMSSRGFRVARTLTP